MTAGTTLCWWQPGPLCQGSLRYIIPAGLANERLIHTANVHLKKLEMSVVHSWRQKRLYSSYTLRNSERSTVAHLLFMIFSTAFVKPKVVFVIYNLFSTGIIIFSSSMSVTFCLLRLVKSWQYLLLTFLTRSGKSHQQYGATVKNQ